MKEIIIIPLSEGDYCGGLCRGTDGHSLLDYVAQFMKFRVNDIVLHLTKSGQLYVEEANIINAHNVTKERLESNFPDVKGFLKCKIMDYPKEVRELTEQNLFSMLLESVTFKDSKHKLRCQVGEEVVEAFHLNWEDDIIVHLTIEERK